MTQHLQPHLVQLNEHLITLRAYIQPPQQVTKVLSSLMASFQVLYLHYEIYFKLLALVAMVYIFYKLGNWSVSDKVFKQRQQLKQMIDRKNNLKTSVPQKIKAMKKSSYLVVTLIVISCSAYFYVKNYQLEHLPLVEQYQFHIYAFIVSLASIFVYTNLKRVLLSKRLNEVHRLQVQVTKKLNKFTESLGPKVLTMLKHHLCRQKLISYSSSKSINQCSKQQCKQERSILKAKNQAIALLIEDSIVDFQWCSICKKRLPFDEYLEFQAKQYQTLENATQEQEIKYKLQYLVDGLQRMRKWLGQTSPCNCSKLYWTNSTKRILQYKKTQKSLQAKIKEIESKHKQIEPK